MRSFYLVTWNTQGCAISNEEKKQVLIRLVKEYRDFSVIFAIQEAGANQALYSSLGGKSYKFYFPAPKGAGNDRCSLGFLVPADLPHKFSTITSRSSRDIPCCTLEGPWIRIACIHATAHADAATQDVKYALKCLERNTLPFILAGDMNSLPKESEHEQISSSIRLVHSDEATHKSGNELDYFYVHSSVSTGAVAMEAVDPSDHNPVILEVLY